MQDKDNDPLLWPNVLTEEQTIEKINIIQQYYSLLKHRYGEDDYKFRRVHDALHHILRELDETFTKFVPRKSFNDVQVDIEAMYRCWKYGFYTQDGPDRPNEEKARK